MNTTAWSINDVKSAMDGVFDLVRREQPQLKFGSVTERSTAHRIAYHMESAFEAWNVDCEYNLNEQTHKFLMSILQHEECREQNKTGRIFPDIIVHHRGQCDRDNNLLVVEMKRYDRDCPCDRKKLEGLTSTKEDYGYQFGLYINIEEGKFECRWFTNGMEYHGDAG